MNEPKSKRSYKVNSDFVRPEPSAAEFFSYCPLDEWSNERRIEMCRTMEDAGARVMRITVVSDEHPNDLYPDGYWLEGWRDRLANQLPFGAANPKDGTISPPLTYREPVA